MPELLTSSDFSPHRHTVFKLESPLALELELTEIEDRSHAQLEQFSLIFAGPRSQQLDQGTYVLVHAHMGEITLFLTPLGPSGERSFYEAAFTRFKGADGAGRRA
jgi:hypothetical protein